MRYLIGLDLGTTCVKALLFDETGRLCNTSSVNDKLLTPRPGWVEQNAESWVELSAEVIRDVTAKSGISPEAVNALSISSQGITSVPVDKKYKPLRNAISWLDQRAVKEIDLVRSLKGDEQIYAITGKTLNPSYTIGPLLWLKNNEPEIYNNAYKILLPQDYLCAFLCNIPIIDHTLASGTMLYDVPNQCWSDELFELFDINRNLFSELHWSGTPIGTLTEEASKLLELNKKTLVVTGGQDQKVAAYGANLQIGSATISLGTCAAIEFLFDHAPKHPDRAIPASSYLIPGFWVLESCVGTAGTAIDWVRDTFFENLSYDDLNNQAKLCVKPESVFFYPFLQGAGNPHNRLVNGVITGLTIGTAKSEIIRAVFEGIVMEINSNFHSAKKAGVSVNDIFIFGGGSKSPVLCQMLADVLGCQIQAFSTPEMGAFGAAKLAAKAVGIENFSLPVDTVWEPDNKKQAWYTDRYHLYQENLKEVLKLK